MDCLLFIQYLCREVLDNAKFGEKTERFIWKSLVKMVKF